MEKFLDTPEGPLVESYLPQSEPNSIERSLPRISRQKQGRIKENSHFATVDPRIATMSKSVLSQRRRVAVLKSQPMASFSDLGGDLIDAACIADLLQKKGFKVTLDDILQHPTLEALGEMCSMG